MKLKNILNEISRRGSWGSYTYRVGDDSKKKDEPMKDSFQDTSFAERVADEILGNYPNLLDKKTIRRINLQMIVGKVSGPLSGSNLPPLEFISDYLKKKHKIKVK
jgi:hypothetical protein